MPVHVGEMTSEVTVLDGELPLSEAQVERLLRLLEQRLERRARERRQGHEATALRGSALPPAPPRG